MAKILIIVGGPKHKLDSFIEAGKDLKIDVTTARFSEINYTSGEDFKLRVGNTDLGDFDTIYLRMIGKRLEDATLVVQYAKKKGIRLVDRFFSEADMLPLSLGKAVETKRLIENNITIPVTYLGSLETIAKKGERLFGFPFLIKSTTGKKAREVWLPKDKEDFERLLIDLRKEEKLGTRFFASEFIKASQRVRVFVLGTRVIGAITRPTKWRKRFIKKVNGEYPEGIKESLHPIPKEINDLALAATNALKLDVAGVDILKQDATGKLFVIEVNAAPAWKAVAKDTGLNIEKEILKFLAKDSGTNIKNSYQERFKKFGTDPKSLFWGSLGASHQRFRQMWAEIDFDGKSVLDVGCGFGEMAKFLFKRYKGVNYTGVDIVPEFIIEAKNRYPKGKFEVRDYFAEPGEEKYDVVLASGTINSNVSDNMSFRKKAIKVMFEHAKKVFVFNMLGGYPQPVNKAKSNVWYTDSLEILKYCLTLTRRTIFRSHYHPTDFTILMYPVKKK